MSPLLAQADGAWAPTELAAAVTLLMLVVAGLVYLLDTIYLRKKHFNQHLAESSVWRKSAEDKALALTREHELLMAGPITRFSAALEDLQAALREFTAHEEVRHEKVLAFLNSVDVRVARVESTLGSVTTHTTYTVDTHA
jgi:hypothetical protein